jgi:hypothetical protein
VASPLDAKKNPRRRERNGFRTEAAGLLSEEDKKD